MIFLFLEKALLTLITLQKYLINSKQEYMALN